MVHCSGCYEYAFEYTRFHFFFLTGDSLKELCARANMSGELYERIWKNSPARLCKFAVNDI